MKTLFIFLQRLLPQHLLSRLVGYFAELRIGWFKNMLIRVFIRIFKVDMSEAESPHPADYEHFNAFFTRRLKTDARPVSGQVCSPADGTVSAVGNIDHDRIFQAKGIDYSLEKLLASSEVSQFIDGSFITIYLSPRDYHRVHTPIDSSLNACRYIPGTLFSVNETTTARVPGLFAANERLVCRFDTASGPMCLVMVGAMIVAAIQPVWRSTPWEPREPAGMEFSPPRDFMKGDEFASFKLGSTVILVFPEKLSWCVSAGQQVRLGQPLVTGERR